MDNQRIKIGAIVTYTEKGQKANKSSALGWYSKNLYEEMDEKTRKSIIIFSDIKKNRNSFCENNINVIECWHRGSLFFWLEILREIKNYPSLEIIHIQHEFNQFGGLFTIPLSLLMIMLIRIFSKKKIIITLHGVISQRIIDKNFIKINNLFGPSFMIKFVFKTYYKVANMFINQIIVHENPFREILLKEYAYNKPISVIPIGVEDKKISLTKKSARKDLKINNKNIILFFGFLAGYKGIDLLIDAFNNIKDNDYYLIIAGGKPSRVEKDEKYNTWYDTLVKKCIANTNIRMTGFLKDEDLEKYFVASDLTVFPYLFPLSASGVITLAIAHEIPFIVSDSFKGIIKDEFIFNKNSNSLKNKILEFFKNNKKEYNEYVQELKEKRSWKNSAAKTNEIYQKLQKIADTNKT